MKLGKYSFGLGDRFAHQGEAQLNAIKKARENGIEITPVWNKSFREHTTVKSIPSEVRKEADEAVRKLNWDKAYFVDADHINLKNVEGFLPFSDFFTIDVADSIGKKGSDESINKFIDHNQKYVGELTIPGIDQPFKVDDNLLRRIADKFLYATEEASRIYNHIKSNKEGDFIAEVSMDEVDDPQTPVELFFILSALALNKVPLQTIAPKFTGRFNKGVDYVGNVDQFSKEFLEDIFVIDFAIKEFNLPEDLKLSVHSGSDKFSIYQPINEIIKKHNKGIHIKTAGTTWLEELIGLSLSGDKGLSLAKNIYVKAFDRFDELTGPYATVIDIDKLLLPSKVQIQDWDGNKFANSLRHDEQHPEYNPNFRQLLHCAYKIAAELGEEYTNALKENKDIIAENVTENIYERHVMPIFSGK